MTIAVCCRRTDQGIKVFIDSNEALIELFDISQKDVMNLKTNDKLWEQALSNNAVGRSCRYVCS